MSIPTDINKPIIEALYCEALVLADQAVVEEVGGGEDALGAGEVLGHYQGAAVLAEEVERALVAPGGVAELDGEADVAGELSQEAFEGVELVDAATGGKLDEDGCQFGIEVPNRVEEVGHFPLAAVDGGAVVPVVVGRRCAAGSSTSLPARPIATQATAEATTTTASHAATASTTSR